MGNTIAYYDITIITSVKSFTVQAPGLNQTLVNCDLTRKYYTRVELNGSGSEKHSSLLQYGNNYGSLKVQAPGINQTLAHCREIGQLFLQ